MNDKELLSVNHEFTNWFHMNRDLLPRTYLMLRWNDDYVNYLMDGLYLEVFKSFMN